MRDMNEGMELWAIVPELILAGLVLILLPLGAFLAPVRKSVATWVALTGLTAAAGASGVMLGWAAQPVFGETYAVDPFATYFKLFGIAATAIVLLATESHFRGSSQEGAVPALLTLASVGIVGLAASQDLVLIALFLQLITVASYVLVGVAKQDRRATEGALKLFLFSATAGSVMLYGMSLLYGLTGTLRLPELAARLPAAPVVVVLTALGFVLVGYGFKITLVPFHAWAPDTYQGAPTPISGYLAVAPKAAALAVLARTLIVAVPAHLGHWPEILATLAAVTMTVGNVLALPQSSTKRLLAYSSIGQAGYLLVGIAAASREALALPGLLLYLAVYMFMNLGAFLAVEAIERQIGSDRIEALRGFGRLSPWTAGVLTLSLLSLAGIPPLGGFIGKTVLFAAALGAGWTSLAILMALNTALSLFYYLRILESLYFRPALTSQARSTTEPLALRTALVLLGIGTVAGGVFPQSWARLAVHASALLAK